MGSTVCADRTQTEQKVEKSPRLAAMTCWIWSVTAPNMLCVARLVVQPSCALSSGFKLMP